MSSTRSALAITLLILGDVGMAACGHLLLRAGMRAMPRLETGTLSGWFALFTQPLVVLGLLLWGGSTLLWLMVLSRAPLSYAYCIGSLNYVIVPLAAARLFNEPLPPLRLVGMGLIFAGVLLTIYGNLRVPQ